MQTQTINAHVNVAPPIMPRFYVLHDDGRKELFTQAALQLAYPPHRQSDSFFIVPEDDFKASNLGGLW